MYSEYRWFQLFSLKKIFSSRNGGYQLWSFDNVFKNKQIPIGDNLNLIFGTAVFGHYKLVSLVLNLPCIYVGRMYDTDTAIVN